MKMKWSLLGIVSNLNFSKGKLGKCYTMPKSTALEIFYRKKNIYILLLIFSIGFYISHKSGIKICSK